MESVLVRKKSFIISGSKRQTGNRHTSDTSRRSKTNQGFMYNRIDTVSVCKTFYLTTLGFNTKNNFFGNQALSSVNDASIGPKEDSRGKAANLKKMTEKLRKMKKHIERELRERTPYRRLLPSNITKKNMRKDFIQKNSNIICSMTCIARF